MRRASRWYSENNCFEFVPSFPGEHNLGSLFNSLDKILEDDGSSSRFSVSLPYRSSFLSLLTNSTVTLSDTHSSIVASSTSSQPVVPTAQRTIQPETILSSFVHRLVYKLLFTSPVQEKELTLNDTGECKSISHHFNKFNAVSQKFALLKYFQNIE